MPNRDAKSIALAAPIRPGASSGNSVTAHRWQHLLGQLGHRVQIVPVDETVDSMPGTKLAPDADLVIALHARRCAAAVGAAIRERPQRPVVVALAGTDLYRDLPESSEARNSLESATRFVVLQEHGLDHLGSMESRWRQKARVIHQSVPSSGLVHAPREGVLVIAVLAHLRDVKDPLLTATAVRQLPDASTTLVVHAGGAHTPEWEHLARHESARNRRYQWLGEMDGVAASQLLASATALACTSKLEGGANVVTEAIALGVPVIGTDIGGNRGLLGSDHPGLVPVGNAHALAGLIERLETRPELLAELRQRSIDRQWMTDPDHEQAQWQELLEELM